MKKIFLLAGLSVALQAAPFAVFNTGVSATNVVLPTGTVDPHYVGVTPTSTVFVGTGLDGLWINNNSVSKWVGPDAAAGDGTYSLIYRTTFDLTGFDAATAAIAGRWATDNFGTDIKLNGVSTSQTSATFSSFSNFTLNSGFVAGLNTIDFLWNNAGGPGGLRVEFTSANANLIEGQGVPEPGTVGLLLAGLAAFAVSRRSKVSAV